MTDPKHFNDLSELEQNILIATKVMGRELNDRGVIICVNCAFAGEPHSVLPYTEWFGEEACLQALTAVENLS